MLKKVNLDEISYTIKYFSFLTTLALVLFLFDRLQCDS